MTTFYSPLSRVPETKEDGDGRPKGQNLELEENLMDWWSPDGSPLSRYES